MIYLRRNIYFYFKYIVVNLRVREVAMTLIDESSVYHASLTNTSRSSQLQKIFITHIIQMLSVPHILWLVCRSH